MKKRVDKMSLIKKNSYARYDLFKDLKYEGIEHDYNELLEYFNDLPIDEYGGNGNRYRRYSRAIILPETGEIVWLPTINKDNVEYSAYFQGKYNPEHLSAYREFHSLSKTMKNNKLLNKIITHDYNETFWDEKDKILPLHVGIHFVKLSVKKNGEKAVSSPDCLHQDGEPFTFAHLIERRNVKGGTNVIAFPTSAGKKPDDIDNEEIIEVFEIINPLESYGVYDPKVSHYVSSVEKNNGDDEAVRSVILIDFQQTVVANIDE